MKQKSKTQTNEAKAVKKSKLSSLKEKDSFAYMHELIKHVPLDCVPTSRSKIILK